MILQKMNYPIVFVDFGGLDLLGEDFVEEGWVGLGFFHGGESKEMICY